MYHLGIEWYLLGEQIRDSACRIQTVDRWSFLHGDDDRNRGSRAQANQKGKRDWKVDIRTSLTNKVRVGLFEGTAGTESKIP